MTGLTWCKRKHCKTTEHKSKVTADFAQKRPGS